jgi:hypothetical protein
MKEHVPRGEVGTSYHMHVDVGLGIIQVPAYHHYRFHVHGTLT